MSVSTDHPRLFLRPARLRLLKRERERSSARWKQFEALVTGKAPLPEPAFALALYHQIAADPAAGRQAVAAAFSGDDLRQQALVFDWCQDVLEPGQSKNMAARLLAAISGPPADSGIGTARSRLLAAVALYEHEEAGTAPDRELERALHNWWPGIIAGLAQGRGPITRDDAFPLYEFLHATRDNTLLELRESRPDFFRGFPIGHLLSHYPAVFRAPENDFYIGASRRSGEPDLRGAALSRAAELAMVAYDTNAIPSQLLQGWLMHDRFSLLGTFGAPYEFLWANPYQPGLSYDRAPLYFHDPDQGQLFARTSWEDDAAWFGCFEGAAQVFRDGRRIALDPRQPRQPLDFGKCLICPGIGAARFRLSVEEAQAVFLLGLEPHRLCRVEIEGQKAVDAVTDAGGTLELSLPRLSNAAIRVRPAPR